MKFLKYYACLINPRLAAFIPPQAFNELNTMNTFLRVNFNRIIVAALLVLITSIYLVYSNDENDMTALVIINPMESTSVIGVNTVEKTIATEWQWGSI